MKLTRIRNKEIDTKSQQQGKVKQNFKNVKKNVREKNRNMK